MSSPSNSPDKPTETGKPSDPYTYFVDGVEYTSDNQHTTGALIKAKLPESKRGYTLFEESRGGGPDKLITDDTTVTFNRGKEALRFYTVPPATFGGQ